MIFIHRPITQQEILPPPPYKEYRTAKLRNATFFLSGCNCITERYKCMVAFKILSWMHKNSSRKRPMFARDAARCTFKTYLSTSMTGLQHSKVFDMCFEAKLALRVRAAWGRHQLEGPAPSWPRLSASECVNNHISTDPQVKCANW